jgi:hypothetical protein
MYGLFGLHERTLSLKSEPWPPLETAVWATAGKKLRLEVEVQNNADNAAYAEYRCPNQRVQTILSLVIEWLDRILALYLDLVDEGGATFAVALLDQLEDRLSLGWLALDVCQKITAA